MQFSQTEKVDGTELCELLLVGAGHCALGVAYALFKITHTDSLFTGIP
jgi:hypothetical protein